MKRLAVFAVAIISCFGMTSAASAQYPPPESDLIVSVSDSTPPPNSIVTITWSMQDSQAALPPEESSRQSTLTIAFFTQTPTCTPAIASQPGTDANVRFVGETVDDEDTVEGSSELYTGSTPGPIVVRISCVNGATAQVTVVVEGAAPQVPTSTPSTPQQPPSVQQPPSAGQPDRGGAVPRPPQTGSLGDGSSDSAGLAVQLTVLSLLGVSAVVVGARLLTRKR